MPKIDSSSSAGTAVVEREAAVQEDEPCTPAIPLRKADGNLSKFDEIVTPHPVVAFLFRRRTFIVLLGILCMVPWAQPRPWTLGVGVALSLLAEVVRIWAAGTIHKTEELTTAGPYAFVRHPLYVGSFIHAVALCFMTGLWQSVFINIPLFLILYSAAVTTEEAMLYKLFGERYAAYCRRVPRFIPRLQRPEQGRGRFDWKQVRANKEYVNIIWVVVLSSIFVAKMFWQF